MPKQEPQGGQKNAPKKSGAGANKPKQGGDNKPKQGDNKPKQSGDNKPKQGGDNKPKQGDNKPKQSGDNKTKQQNVGGNNKPKKQSQQQQSGAGNKGGANNNQQKKQTNEKNQPKKPTGDKNQTKQQPQTAGNNNNQQKKQQPQQKQGAKNTNQQKKPTADNKQKPAGNQNVKKQQKVNRPKVSDQQKDGKGGKGKNVKATQPIKKKVAPTKPVKATKDIKLKGKGDKFDNKARIDLILRRKYQNPNKPTPTQLETQICQYLVDLEASSKDLKPHLRDLGIVAAREIAISNTKNAIVIFIPYTQQDKWKKIQEKVIRELGKKFNGQDVLFVVQRKVMKLNQIKNNYPRPRNQTITSVHNSILEDLVYPTKIVGKRIRFRVGGKRILKVYLDPKDTKDLENKLLTFSKVYRKLTNKLVLFMFPRYVI